MENRLPLLAVKQLGREIPGRWLWRNLSFMLLSGQRLAVVGPSGSGKSVLLRCLAGLTSFTEGELFFKGGPVTDLQMPRYRSKVLYVPQTPAMVEGTVRDNLTAVLAFRSNRDVQFDEEWVGQVLQRVGRAPDFLDKSADTLSGGERQIVAFIRALQLKPDVLLLDEPIASLDSAAGEQLVTLIRDALSSADVGAVIWTAHQEDDPGVGYDAVLEIGQTR